MSLKAPERPIVTANDDSHNRLGWKKPVAALALLGTTAVGAFIGLNGDSDKAPKDRDTTEPVASASAKPGKDKAHESQTTTPEQTASPEQGATRKFGISAADFETKPELMGQEYYSQFNELMIGGIDYEVSMAEERFVKGDLPYIAEITAPMTTEFVEELFIPEWEANPALTDYVTTTLAIANRTHQLRLMSYSGGPDSTPYVRETVIQSMKTTGAPITTTSTRWTERDNGAETSVFDNLDGPDVNTFAGGETFVWVNVDGEMKISDVSHYDG